MYTICLFFLAPLFCLAFFFFIICFVWSIYLFFFFSSSFFWDTYRLHCLGHEGDELY